MSGPRWVRAWFLCSCWQCTVMSIPSVGAGAMIGGSLWLTVLPKGHTCPSGEAKVTRGGQALLMMPRGLRRGGEMSPKALISLETSLQSLGGWSLPFVLQSDYHAVRAFGELILLGPLWWGFNNRTGCRISSSIGYGYFDTNSSP
jgi:hypothetical protein